MKSVLTLGTFDGVHRGHQRILRLVVNRARQLGLRSVVLSFDMPPRVSKKRSPEPVLLTTLHEKIQLLKSLGIIKVHLLVFNRVTASTPPEKFFADTIVRRFRAQEVIVGPRVAFGKNRTGRLEMLKRLGKCFGVKIRVVSRVKESGDQVSSSRIRALLACGDLENAGRQLGYHYSISGKIIHGNHRGRHIGYPTANIAVEHMKLLPPGVFWVKVFSGSRSIPLTSHELSKGIDGLCNVGTRPTFTPNAKKLQCEVFLFKKPSYPLYGRTMRVVFMRRIRSERRFTTTELLRRRIAVDFQLARRWSHNFSLQNRCVSIQ